MRWSRLGIGLLLGCLCVAGTPRTARAQAESEAEPAAHEAEPERNDPAAVGSAAIGADQEPDPADPAAPADAQAAVAGEEADAGEPDPDKPGRLVVSTDSECNVFIGGQLEGRATPGEQLEIGVELGEIEIRATATGVPGASWEKTVELTEARVEAIRVKMKRAIRLFRKEERQSGVYRDPKTLLMWPKRDNGRDADLRRAYAYCRDLQTGGFEDWRLPTLAELRSLEAIWGRSTYRIRGDLVLSECCIWTSDYDGSERASTYNFRSRQPFQTNAGYEIGLRALCVRTWDPATDPPEVEADAADD
jgi:hypothetical protein